MFPDSSVAKSFCAARTKSTCILNMALRPHFEKILIDHMKTNPFSIAVDGSNDTDLQKMNPVTVRIFYSSCSRVCTRFLDMCLTSGTEAGTAEAIFSAMCRALESRDILWNNCVGIGVDNTSVNVGRHVHVLWTKILTFTLWVVHAILSTTLPKKLDKCFVRYADNSVIHQIEILQLCM